jgi:hypothetical protein
LSIPKALKMSKTSNLCLSSFTLAKILFNTLWSVKIEFVSNVGLHYTTDVSGFLLCMCLALVFFWWHGHLGRVFTGWKPVPRQETAHSIVWLNTYPAFAGMTSHIFKLDAILVCRYHVFRPHGQVVFSCFSNVGMSSKLLGLVGEVKDKRLILANFNAIE